VSTAREVLARDDDGRALVRRIDAHPADLLPDWPQTPDVCNCTRCLSRYRTWPTRHSAAELTATETVIPGTDLRLIFTLNGPL